MLDAILPDLPPIESGLDLGCGVGTWLSALVERGATDIVGLDGPWVPRALLEIAPSSFRATDFEAPPTLERRFDLAMSFEVAEHVSPDKADGFVRLLTDAADIVLLGAAIPGQGGVGHVNEQWPRYWAERFTKHGYRALDVVRPRIWGDAEIAYWYRQNIVLYVAEEAIARDAKLAALAAVAGRSVPIGAVHPEAYERARLGRVRWYAMQWRRRLRRQGDAITV